MILDQETLRFIFGLKLRGLRLDRGLSLKELSKKTGLSPSYLNEIEKGKKYPKSEKILILAQALGENYDDLISLKLKKELSLVTQLIEKNVFTGMPFEIFGIPAATIFELLAERPKKMSALVGTLLELARGHNITVDDFFYATLRAYLDMHQNYFPGLEEKAEQFAAEMKLDTKLETTQLYSELCQKLEKHYSVKVTESQFEDVSSHIDDLYYFVKTDRYGQLVLFVNASLSLKEKVLIVARELGFQYLKIKNRPQHSLIKNLDSFEQLFNHFSASYFASSILMPKERVLADLEGMLSQKTWNEDYFRKFVVSYSVPYESVFQRLTQLLPRFFGLDHIFFLRFDYDSKIKKYRMLRELHLSELHSPHGIANDEHYCARWVTTRLIDQLKASGKNEMLGIQKSQFFATENEYLNISFSFRHDLNSEDLGCVTLGILLNPKSRGLIQFVSDDKITTKTVSDTCERCGVENCQERRAPHQKQLLPGYIENVRAAIESI